MRGEWRAADPGPNRMQRARLAIVLLLAIALARPVLAAAGRPAAVQRRLAVVPALSAEQTWRLWTPFVEYLRRETGEAWELALQPTHAALVEAFCAGKVDVAFLGPVPLGRIAHACGGVPFLVALGPSGSTTFRSVLLTGDRSIRSVAELRGRPVGFFRGSTAAHVVPVKLLADAGVGPDGYRPVFLESQDRLVAALLTGEISAAGVKSSLYRRFQKEQGLRVLKESGPLPNHAFAAHPSFPASARDRFAAYLLRLRPRGRAADAAIVERWDEEIRYGFAREVPEHLAGVQALRELTERILGASP